MSFDPCGTRHLDGDEILKRLAETLGMTSDELRLVLKSLSRI